MANQCRAALHPEPTLLCRLLLGFYRRLELPTLVFVSSGAFAKFNSMQFSPAYLLFSLFNFLLEVLYLVVQGGHHCLGALVRLYHGTWHMELFPLLTRRASEVRPRLSTQR